MGNITHEPNTRTVAFVWRRIAEISQYKLGLESKHSLTFDQWSQEILDGYDQDYTDNLDLLQRQKAALINAGAEHVFIAPHAIGSAKMRVFERLLNELTAGTFLLITSWADIGSQPTAEGIVKMAARQEIFFILPAHKSIRALPYSQVAEVHQNWVVESIQNTYMSASSKRLEILALQERGLSAEDIQRELSMSKSTYYRHLNAAASDGMLHETRGLIAGMLALDATPQEIQLKLKITSRTYNRIIGQMALSDSTGTADSENTNQ